MLVAKDSGSIAHSAAGCATLSPVCKAVHHGGGLCQSTMVVDCVNSEHWFWCVRCPCRTGGVQSEAIPQVFCASVVFSVFFEIGSSKDHSAKWDVSTVGEIRPSQFRAVVPSHGFSAH